MTDTDRIMYGDEPIEINAGRATVTLTVRNTGDRAIQVGSHFHFFEANRALSFDREKAYGMHLDIPAGTAVRIEPGDTRQVTLVEFAGGMRVVGFAGLVDGGLRARDSRTRALRRLAELGYADQPEPGATVRAPGEEPPARKEPPTREEPPARKAPAKKAAPKKPAAKEPAAKEPAAKQPAAKQPAARKKKA